MAQQNDPISNYFKLSENDLDIIKALTNDKEISSLARKTLTILSVVFGGLHHLEYTHLKKFDWFSTFYNEFNLRRTLATFDSQELTLLVIMAHDLAVRIEIRPNGKYLNLIFHERTRKGDFSRRHPTLGETMDGFRKGNKHFA